MEFGDKTQNKGYCTVQAHSRSSRSVPIESPYATSYQWVVITDILSRTVSELSQLIVQILDTLRSWAPFGRLETTYDVHLGLTGKRVVDFVLVLIELFSLGVTDEALRAKIDRKSAISRQCRQFDPNFQVEGVALPIIFHG